MRVFTPLTAILCLLLSACDDNYRPLAVPAADAVKGERLVTQYQCVSCHAIPGIPGASGDAGPSLAAFGKRSYIAGRIPNQPAMLSQWLLDPPALKPGTMMPKMGMSQDDARHMAAYLYTLDE